jgi:hypothetical protein
VYKKNKERGDEEPLKRKRKTREKNKEGRDEELLKRKRNTSAKKKDCRKKTRELTWAEHV